MHRRRTFFATAVRRGWASKPTLSRHDQVRRSTDRLLIIEDDVRVLVVTLQFGKKFGQAHWLPFWMDSARLALAFFPPTGRGVPTGCWAGATVGETGGTPEGEFGAAAGGAGAAWADLLVAVRQWMSPAPRQVSESRSDRRARAFLIADRRVPAPSRARSECGRHLSPYRPTHSCSRPCSILPPQS